MKLRAVVLVGFGACVAGLAVLGAARTGNPLPPDLKSLQGTWTLVESKVQGQLQTPRVTTQWIFVGNKLYLKNGNRTAPQGVVLLDPTTKPKTMDLLVNGQPSLLGIYKLKGHQLTVCAAATQRPTKFSPQTNMVLSILERAAPAVSKHHGRGAVSGIHRGPRPNAPSPPSSQPEAGSNSAS